MIFVVFTFLFLLLQVVISGFRGTVYPEDIPGQHALLRPLIEPILLKVLGSVPVFELFSRRGFLRNSVIPPCEVDLKDPSLASRFRSEAARLSRAKHDGFSQLYFNPCVTLATRYVLFLLPPPS